MTDSPAGSAESLTANLSAGESYTLAVLPVAGAQSAYALNVDADVEAEVPDIVNGVTIGDAGAATTPYSAATDASGVIAISGSTGFGSDRSDAFEFAAPGTGPVTLNVSGVEAGETLTVPLLDDTGSTVDASVSGTATVDGLLLESSLFAGERYTVEVAAVNGPSEYALTITGTVNSPINDTVAGVDIGDAGDSIDLAFATDLDLSGDVSIQGAAGIAGDGADFYRFTAPGSGSLQVDLSGLGDDLNLLLLDAGWRHCRLLRQ